MSSSKVARRYSKALLALCDKDKSHEQVASELANYCAAIADHSDVSSFLTNPSMDSDGRKTVLTALNKSLGLSTLSTHFLYLLNERERLEEMPGILEDFQERLDKKAGRLHAKVTSAEPLDKKAIDQLKAALEKSSGKTVVLETTVDPTILGGVVTQVGNVVLDGSVQSMLSNLRKQMLQAAQQ